MIRLPSSSEIPVQFGRLTSSDAEKEGECIMRCCSVGFCRGGLTLNCSSPRLDFCVDFAISFTLTVIAEEASRTPRTMDAVTAVTNLLLWAAPWHNINNFSVQPTKLSLNVERFSHVFSMLEEKRTQCLALRCRSWKFFWNTFEHVFLNVDECRPGVRVGT